MVSFWFRQEKLFDARGEDGVEFESFGLDIDMEEREVRIAWYSTVSLYRDHFESMNVKIKENCRKKSLG